MVLFDASSKTVSSVQRKNTVSVNLAFVVFLNKSDDLVELLEHIGKQFF